LIFFLYEGKNGNKKKKKRGGKSSYKFRSNISFSEAQPDEPIDFFSGQIAMKHRLSRFPSAITISNELYP